MFNSFNGNANNIIHVNTKITLNFWLITKCAGINAEKSFSV